ncbi:MAG: glycoside hydrolase family 97 catalytic domain-containing protein, partial [Rhizobacter sp.]|nr:glycoside hydrolase family 97 catalytic domain-containing protein [Chlorobiales bacterium]
ALPEIDLPELIRYAKQKGVRLRFWMHWEAAKTWMRAAFPIYKSWGIEGVMIDFMDRDDQEMMTFQRELLQLAAENELTVTMHGSSKPTGLERTYPNFMTSEGVLNLEHDKWGDVGCPPEHEVTVPFTRMLAGPLDFHQGSFRGVSVEQYKPQSAAPVVIGSPSRTLASYVVYQNHLPMVADYPEAYIKHPATAMLAQIPTSWDETKVLSGNVGEHIMIARRYDGKGGNDWYLGAMNDRQPRTFDVPLKFLSTGRYRAEIYADNLKDNPKGTSPRKLVKRTQTVTAADVLKIQLVAAGGYFVRLTSLSKNKNQK